MSALADDHPLLNPELGLADAPYLSAAWQRPTKRTPIWFQRQAGRSLPEYRALRGSGNILDTIGNPELAAEITLQPVRRYGVDAAILFSDIVVPAAAVGFGVEVVPGVGPVAPAPFESRRDLERLPPLEPEQHTPYVLETARRVVAGLESEGLNVPLIGFAGAPFTVASYLIEGKPSRDHARTKALMLNDAQLWHDLMERLTDLAIASARSQVLAGASAVQLFDSWAGTLSQSDYEAFVLEHSRRFFAELSDLAAAGVPRAHFGVTTGELLGLMASVECEVLGVDWRVRLDVAAERIAAQKLPTLQGNLDPGACLAAWPAVKEKVDDILRSASGLPGHIFNLGHGVLPQTDPEVLLQVVRHVQQATSQASSQSGDHPGGERG